MTQPQQATFIDPTVGAGTSMKMRDLRDRAVIIIPKSYDPAAPGLKPGTTQERVTLDVLVLDGGPITYGDNRTAGTPATHRIETPCYVAGMADSHVNIVSATRPHAGTGAIMLGRIVQGITTTPGNNPPWNFAPLEANDPARGLAARIWAERSLGTWKSPEPIELNAQPAPAAAAPACPSGWDPAVWAAMPESARAQIAGSMSAPTGF